MKDIIERRLKEAVSIKQAIANDRELISLVEKSAQACVKCLKDGGKVLFAGNGGSAADAQHLAAELSGRYYFDRKPLFGEALHVNTSYLTAVANDYSYNEVYSRLVEAMGRPGDILFAISTSGNSQNILNAVDTARRLDMISIGMTGMGGGLLEKKADMMLKVPSNDTPRIQEGHILLGHIICELIESAMFKN